MSSEQANAAALPAEEPVAKTYDWPLVTLSLLVLLAAIFAVEVIFGVEPWQNALEPSIQTLAAFGGLQYPLVVDQGQWYRLFSAPLLHADIFHLLFNGVALYFAGRGLEQLVGRAWFAALFVIGGLGGTFASLFINAHSIVSVGASGAIMALFAALFVCSFNTEDGERKRLQGDALRVLIPSVIPLASAGGIQVDYAAHIGGGLIGGFMGLVLLALQINGEEKPRLQRAATFIAALGLIGAIYAGIANARNYSNYAELSLLIPKSELPDTNDEALKQAAVLLAKYPHDPRAHLYQTLVHLKFGDTAGAERELRAGLQEKNIFTLFLNAEFKAYLESLLALVLVDLNRIDEAKEIAKPLCPQRGLSLKEDLQKSGLCPG